MSLLGTMLAAVLAQSVPVDENYNIPQPEGSHAERLEEIYGERDYRALGEALFQPASEADLVTGLDWLGMKYRTDGSSFISQSYAMMLDGFAQGFPPEQAQQFRGTALAALVQAYIVARIDGQQCEDITARAVKAEQLISTVAGSPLLQADEPTRRLAAFMVMANEEITWPHRQQLDQASYLCAGGMSAMIAGMAGGQMRERTPREGEIGRQIEVIPPAGLAYPRRDNADWLADAEALRQSREDIVAQVLRIDSVPTMEEMRRYFEQGQM
jgi:hypothetical protein